MGQSEVVEECGKGKTREADNDDKSQNVKIEGDKNNIIMITRGEGGGPGRVEDGREKIIKI